MPHVGRRRQLIDLCFKARLFDVPGLGRRSLTVLAYHRVRSEDARIDTPSLEFDESVFGPDRSNFAAQMAWLARNAAPIDEGTLLAALDGDRPLPPKAVLVTFDDGYKDNHTVALPVLRQFGIPALFFITPTLIDERRLGFWDHVSWLTKRTKVASFTFGGRDYTFAGGRQAVASAICRRLKTDLGGDPAAAMLDLAAALAVDLPSRERQDAELMSWADINDLIANGMAIGAHGMTHRIMTALSPAAQRWELAAAKDRLEQMAHAPIRSVAFPSGSPEYLSDACQRLALEAGYRACFTFETGSNDARVLSRRDIRRVPVGDVPASVACAVAAPWMLGESFYV